MRRTAKAIDGKNIATDTKFANASPNPEAAA
jgi:hypothetical protein